LAKVAYDRLGARTAVILYEKTNAGNDNADGFEKPFVAMGGKVLAKIDFGRDVNDFTAIATRIASLGRVDVLPTFALEGQQVRRGATDSESIRERFSGFKGVEVTTGKISFGPNGQNSDLSVIHFVETQKDLSWKGLDW